MAWEKMFDNLPMLLNLGEWSSTTSIIGHASIFRDTETGIGRIEIVLTEKDSDVLEHMSTIADIKAIGFAGIMRRPQDVR